MTMWGYVAIVLVIAGLGPAVLVAARGDDVRRLVGLELATPVTVLVLLAISQDASSSASLIVPMVLALLAYIGTLVFVRLLRSRL